MVDQKALNMSTTLTKEEKERIRPVLKAEYMSSDESDAEFERSHEAADSSDDDDANTHLEEQRQRNLSIIN